MVNTKLITSLSASALLISLPLSVLSLNVSAKTPTKKVVEKKIPVQLLGLNDLHGYIEGDSKKDSYGLPVGGMASLAYNFEQEKKSFAKSNRLKSTTSNSLAIQAGDLVGGSPAISGFLQDEPTMNIINAMNFSIGTLGNHEFDEGLDEFQRILKGQAPIKESTSNYEFVKEYREKIASNSSLKSTANASKMMVLSANVVDAKTKKLLPYFKPYTIKKIDGVNVGFIGVVTPIIKEVVLSQHTKDVEIIDPGIAVAKYTRELRSKGVKAITVVAHSPISINTSYNSSIHTQDSKRLNGEVIDMLDTVKKLDPSNSIDVVFAGHSHTFVNDSYNKARIVQAYNHSEAYSVVTGTLSSKTKDFISTPTAKVKYNYTQSDAKIASNETSKKVSSIISVSKSVMDHVLSDPIATMDVASLSKENTHYANAKAEYPLGGSAVGNLVADAQLAKAKTEDSTVDFAFSNSGGVRADLLTVNKDGKFTVTRGSAQAVQPYKNKLRIIEIKGAQVKAVLNEQFKGGYGLEIAGLNYTYNDNGVVDVFVKGAKIEDSKTYKAVLNDFLVGGGDRFPTFAKTRIVNSYIGVDTDVFIDYITSTKVIKAETVTELRLKRVQ